MLDVSKSSIKNPKSSIIISTKELSIINGQLSKKTQTETPWLKGYGADRLGTMGLWKQQNWSIEVL
jgi:hypothetical protein